MPKSMNLLKKPECQIPEPQFYSIYSRVISSSAVHNTTETEMSSINKDKSTGLLPNHMVYIYLRKEEEEVSFELSALQRCKDLQDMIQSLYCCIVLLQSCPLPFSCVAQIHQFSLEELTEEEEQFEKTLEKISCHQFHRLLQDLISTDKWSIIFANTHT